MFREDVTKIAPSAAAPVQARFLRDVWARFRYYSPPAFSRPAERNSALEFPPWAAKPCAVQSSNGVAESPLWSQQLSSEMAEVESIAERVSGHHRSPSRSPPTLTGP